MKKIFAIGLFLMVVALVRPSDVNIGWNHTGTPEEVVGYSIYYGPSSRTYTNYVSFGYVTNATISNLPPNSVIFFSGISHGPYNTETGFGNEIQSSPAPTPTNQLPSAVKDFVVTSIIKTIY
jgi:hypothetical protein